MTSKEVVLLALGAVTSVVVVLWEGSALYFSSSIHHCTASSTEASEAALKLLIIGDVHILGHRKRYWIQQAWIDWQAYLSFQAAYAALQPDAVLILGDQLDEGTAGTTDVDYKEYTARFFQVFGPIKTETLFVLGNHDASYGPGMTQSLVRRHEQGFGPANKLVSLNDIDFVVLNTMALETNVLDHQVYHGAHALLNQIETQRKSPEHNKRPLVILTHIPFYRPNDLKCGHLRTKERAHYTYEDPAFEYVEQDHVLSKGLSQHIIQTLEPDYIFSAHTHSVCYYHHYHTVAATGAVKTIPEYTVPTFTWGQRPDPSFAIALVHHSGQNDRDNPLNAHVTTCSLPTEMDYLHWLIAVGGCWLALFLYVYYRYYYLQSVPLKKKEKN
ncbi:metallophosphoesterase 1 [Thraustotheca clavata]|uniref:Metallophosphoesterase 1 n=1 Tax=Thraustotheca clavata TaxID=74557 RepID=A0A1V9ZC07_9STRA|nr:metallophosphoesterase 1 [Thraustotheca clavata]